MVNEHKKRARAMCRAIRTSWRSLQTHLQYAIDAQPENRDDDELFHANAIVQYADSILICAKELRHLNVERKKDESNQPNPD